MNKLIAFFLFNAIFSFSQADINKLDENGKKNGLWKGFFEDSKRLRYQGTFNHGQEIETFNYYDNTQDGALIGVRVFNNTDKSVYTTFYDQKKNIVSEGKSINKLNEGDWKYYHEGSKIVMTLEHYKAGKLNGKKVVFYKNGNVTEETSYVNGIKNGIYKNFTEKGIVLESSNYKNNELDGLAIYKDPTDKIVSKGLYKNGKKTGIWNFYKDGKFVSKTNFNFQGKKFAKRKI